MGKTLFEKIWRRHLVRPETEHLAFMQQPNPVDLLPAGIDRSRRELELPAASPLPPSIWATRLAARAHSLACCHKVRLHMPVAV